MVRAQALHDAAMCVGMRLDPNIAHAQLVQIQRCEHAGFHITANRHYHMRKVQHAQLLEQLRVAGIGLHHMRQFIRQVLHALGVGIYRQNLMPQIDQRFGNSRTKTPQPNHHDAIGLISRHKTLFAADGFKQFTQQLAFPPDNGSWPGMAVRPRLRPASQPLPAR